jgi:hypothetical protein
LEERMAHDGRPMMWFVRLYTSSGRQVFFAFLDKRSAELLLSDVEGRILS